MRSAGPSLGLSVTLRLHRFATRSNVPIMARVAMMVKAGQKSTARGAENGRQRRGSFMVCAYDDEHCCARG